MWSNTMTRDQSLAYKPSFLNLDSSKVDMIPNTSWTMV